MFADVIVSTDAESIAEIARYYGAEVPFLRPSEMAGDLSPDIDWVRYTLETLARAGRACDAFSLLRPTSPFRSAGDHPPSLAHVPRRDGRDSLRAVEPCRQHPGKMWVAEGDRIVPLLKDGPSDPPWHSTPYQALPKVLTQNASLEIAWCRTVTRDWHDRGRVRRALLYPRT